MKTQDLQKEARSEVKTSTALLEKPQKPIHPLIKRVPNPAYVLQVSSQGHCAQA